MMNKIGIYLVIGVILVSFFIPAYTSFFTNDDFFHLRISQPGRVFTSFREFSHFRPLTTQGYYFLSSSWFNNSPRILKLISLATLIVIGYQIYLLSIRLGQSRQASTLAGLLYLTSATHYAHLNYAGTFHELGMTASILAGILCLRRRPGLSPLFFILALMSKETAVIYPALLLLISRFDRQSKVNIPGHVLILALYLFFRYSFFGFAGGDSYAWAISPKIFNTLIWYLLWSFNIPEMWLDFIGPGLRVNPNLLLYWKMPTLAIFSLFLVLVVMLAIIWIKSKKDFRLLVFSGLFFVIGLGPLLFLPWHKFTFYLTLPLVGISIWLGSVLSAGYGQSAKIFLITWILLSLTTYNLSLRTNWITRGAEIASRVHHYFSGIPGTVSGTYVFYDTEKDQDLPWSPAEVMQNTLSDNNYFQVYFPGATALYYGEIRDKIDTGRVLLPARQFLGY